MKIRSAAVAAVCLLAVLPLGQNPAAAAQPDHLGEGTLLGPRLETDPPVRILAATSKYYLTDYGWPSDHSPAPWSIRSAVDGTVKGEYRRLRDDISRAPVVVGDYALEYDATGVAPRKLGADQLRIIQAPSGSTVRDVYPGGMLLSRSDAFVLRTYEGIETPVAGVTAAAKVLDRTDDAFLLGTPTALYILDLQSGTAAEAATLTAETTWAQLTPGRVIWRTASTDASTTLAWKPRTGSGGGTAVVPFNEPQIPLLPLGDDVAVRLPSKELVKVVLEGGDVVRDFVTGVHDAADQGNGRLLVSAQSQIASVGPDGALTTIRQTPPHHGEFADLGLSGDRIVGRSAPRRIDLNPGFDPRPVLFETKTLGSTWTSVQQSSEFYPAPQLAGDALLTIETDPNGGAGTATIRDGKGVVTLPGSYGTTLGRGGKLVGRLMPGGAETEIYSLTKRASIRRFPAPVALAGDTVWTGPNARDQLTGTTNGWSHQVRAAAGCGRALSLQVAGRWAVVDCSGSDQVVDLRQVVPPRTVVLADGWMLGYNFLAQKTAGTDASGLSTVEVKVTDLNTLALSERRYGPSSGRFWLQATIVPDDADTNRMLYRDPDGRPRLVVLDWLAPQPTTDTDTEAPVLTSGDAGPRIRNDQYPQFRFEFTDPSTPTDPASGVTGYDVRYQDRTTPTAPYRAWVTPAGWQKLPKQITSVQHHAVPGTDTCFQARARDRAGNEGAWSQSFCTQVAATAPARTGGR